MCGKVKGDYNNYLILHYILSFINVLIDPNKKTRRRYYLTNSNGQFKIFELGLLISFTLGLTRIGLGCFMHYTSQFSTLHSAAQSQLQILISSLQCSNFSLGRAFVSMSAGLCNVLIFTTFALPFSTSSLIKCSRTSMCLLRS